MKRLIVVVAAALCCAAFAQEHERGGRSFGGPRRGMQMRDGGMMMSMPSPLLRIVMNPDAAEKLGLTEEQKTKLKVLDKGRSVLHEHMEKIREAMRKQTALIEADKINEAAVMASIDEVFALRKEMAKEQMKRLIAVKSILTPEQIKKANEEMKDMPRERGEGMRRGPGGDQHGLHGERRGSGGGHHGRSMSGRRGRTMGGDRHERGGEAK